MQLDKQLRQSIVWRGFYYLSNLALNIILSRVLLASAFGSLFYFVNTFSLIVLIAGCSLEPAFTYFVASKKMEVSVASSVSLITTLVIIIPVYCTLHFLFVRNPFLGDDNIAQLGIVFIAGNILITYFTALFYSLHHYKVPNLIAVIINILTIGLVVYYQHSERIIAYIFFYSFVLQGVMIFIAFVFLNEINPFKTRITAKDIQLLFRFSITALSANLVFFLLYRIDYWFVQANCSSKELGNYIQASKMGQLFLVIPQMLAAAIFPSTASGKMNMNLKISLLRLLRLFLQFLLLFFLLFLFFGNFFFTYLFGNDFNIANTAFLILLPGVFFLSALSLLSAYFGGNDKVSVNLKGALIGLAIVISGNVVLLHWYSIQVAATVSTLGYLTNFLYAWFIFKKQMRFDKKEFVVFVFDDWVWLKNMIFNK
jgi:O-antigen/teichoic acid export membrane protein